jgi:hypothetical protein
MTCWPVEVSRAPIRVRTALKPRPITEGEIYVDGAPLCVGAARCGQNSCPLCSLAQDRGQLPGPESGTAS